MAITVKFIGALRRSSGENTQAVNCETCSVRELIDEISKASPELKRNLVGGEGENQHPNALVLVNGREISVLNGLNTKLIDNDEVVFIPVVHGG
jgi:sulfur-carrier protein